MPEKMAAAQMPKEKTPSWYQEDAYNRARVLCGDETKTDCPYVLLRPISFGRLRRAEAAEKDYPDEQFASAAIMLEGAVKEWSIVVLEDVQLSSGQAIKAGETPPILANLHTMEDKIAVLNALNPRDVERMVMGVNFLLTD